MCSMNDHVKFVFIYRYVTFLMMNKLYWVTKIHGYDQVLTTDPQSLSFNMNKYNVCNMFAELFI